MKRTMVLMLLALLAPVAGAQVRSLTLNQLCANADRVVVGGVTKLEARWAGQKIVTDVTVIPTENLKGTGSIPFIVTIPGGTIGNVSMVASEAPKFAVGEQVVLFQRIGPVPCGVYGWFRGKFTVVNGQIRELSNTTFTQFRQQLADIIENL